MNGAIQLVGGAAMTPASPARFNEEQRRLILDTCCGGASETEAKVLVAIAEARGLNPLLGECYFVKRWDKAKGGITWAVQASIDSFRIKAEETGDYGGQDAPEFEHDEQGNPTVARVRVYRRSVPGRPFAVGEARWSEYVQKTKEGRPTSFWANMPHNQLAKCAEALALRKAFPKVLARIYTPDEMAQADNGKEEQAPATPPKAPASEPEVKEAVNTPTFRAMAAKLRGCRTVADLDAAAKAVTAAFDTGALNKKQREKLKPIFAKRKDEIVKAAPDPAEAEPEDPREAEYEAEASANE